MTALRTLADLTFSALIVCAVAAVVIALIEWARAIRTERQERRARVHRAIAAARLRHPSSRPIRECEADVMRREINAAKARYIADELMP